MGVNDDPGCPHLQTVLSNQVVIQGVDSRRVTFTTVVQQLTADVKGVFTGCCPVHGQHWGKLFGGEWILVTDTVVFSDQDLGVG